MKFEFPSKRWEIGILLFLIEEFSKTLAYFFYNLHLLFHLKSFQNLVSNSWLFSHADDPLRQEIQSELVEHWLSVGVGGHIQLHLGEPPSLSITRRRCLPTRRAWVMPCVVDWMLWSGMVGTPCVPVSLRLPIQQCSSLSKHTNHIFSSFYMYPYRSSLTLCMYSSPPLLRW